MGEARVATVETDAKGSGQYREALLAIRLLKETLRRSSIDCEEFGSLGTGLRIHTQSFDDLCRAAGQVYRAEAKLKGRYPDIDIRIRLEEWRKERPDIRGETDDSRGRGKGR